MKFLEQGKILTKHTRALFYGNVDLGHRRVQDRPNCVAACLQFHNTYLNVNDHHPTRRPHRQRLGIGGYCLIRLPEQLVISAEWCEVEERRLIFRHQPDAPPPQ